MVTPKVPTSDPDSQKTLLIPPKPDPLQSVVQIAHTRYPSVLTVTVPAVLALVRRTVSRHPRLDLVTILLDILRILFRRRG